MKKQSPSKREEELTRALLAWYEKDHRALPWREDPSPYHVWLSEIMLQQTRVEAVKPYYERFLKALPDIAALASCEETKLMKLWDVQATAGRISGSHQKAGPIFSKSIPLRA